MRNFNMHFGAGRWKSGIKYHSVKLLVLFFTLCCGISMNAQINVSFSVDEPSCFGLPDGSVLAIASGGQAPYSYIWSNGTVSPLNDGITAGNYAITVTDNNGDFTIQNVDVGQPSLVTATLVADECSDPITITAIGGGGDPPYMYNWTNGEDTQTITVSPGTYCVTLTDMNYCGTVECITVNYVPLDVSVVTQNLTCPDANDGSLTAVVSGGTAPFDFQWSNGATTPTINNLSPGTYTLTLTDANGCSDTAIGIISNIPTINIFTSSTNPNCIGDSNGNASVSATGGTPPYTFAWSNGQFGNFIANLSAGTYVVTLTDANGCDEIASVNLSPISNLVVGANATPESCNDFNNGTATAIAASGVLPYTYLWSNGATTSNISNLAPGAYTVTVTDAIFCTGTSTVIVQAAPDFSIALSNTSVSTCGANNGTAMVSVTTGVGPFTYNWSTGATNSQISGLPGGTYFVTVTDVNGCQLFGQTDVFEPPLVDVELTATPMVCAGQDDGSVAISLSGGTAPFQYFWNTGANTPFLMNVGAGTYSLTVVDAFGCTDIDQVTINEAPELNLSIAGTQVVCGTGNTGSATVFVNGGMAPFQYFWNTGATTPTISDLPEGTYSVMVVDANGCMSSEEISIDVIDDLVLTMTANAVDCFGGNTGAASVSVSGGSLPYTYLWSNGATSASINNVPANTYTVTVTEANGCSFSNSITIDEAPELNVDITVSALTVCIGDNSGEATAVVVGGTAPYSFLWSNGSTAPFIDNLPAGTYSLTVTDANGCEDDASVTISNSPALLIAVFGTDVVCGAGNTGSASANIIQGVGPFTYLWSNGQTTSTISSLVDGTYTLTVTDANGCEEIGMTTINVIDDIAATFTINDANCFDEESGSATVNATGGTLPYTYLWSNGDTTQTISNVAAGIYTVTITDANGCDITAADTIGQPPSLEVSINSSGLVCFGQALGTATAIPTGGTPPYSFEWNNGETSPTISDVPAGTYTVTVTDANECEATASITITELPELLITVNAPEVICGAENTGEAEVVVLGGTAPYSYSWSNGESTDAINDLPSGTYSVTVTDAQGCTGSSEATIDIVSDLVLNLIERDALCFDDMNGGMLAEVSGGDAPYTFLWNTGDMVNELINVDIGTYSVTVTDMNGCTLSGTGTVEQPDELMALINSTDAFCIGESSGTAMAAAMGGTAPYVYSWSNGLQGSTQNGLLAGTYTVTITDANSCIAISSVEISEPDDLEVNINTPLIECGGTDSGSASAIVIGGTPPYDYEWSNGATTSEILNIPAGIYELTVTDANGCEITGQTITVSELPQLELSFEVTNIVCSNAAIGAIEVTPDGGTSPYTYQWNNGMSEANISGLSAGAYEVTVTDANTCEAVGSVVITQVAALEIDPAFTNVSCEGEEDGTASISVSGGTEPYTFDWSTGDDTEAITDLAPGTYSVTVTGESGCVGIASMTITEPSALNLTTSSQAATCFDFSDGSATVAISGGTPPYSVLWNTGATTISIFDLTAGTYSVVVSDANACTAETVVTVTDPNPLEITANMDDNTCDGEAQGAASANTVGGTPPYTYEWSNGETSNNITGLIAGDYFVTVTDANECSASTLVTIDAIPNPTCEVSMVNNVILGGDGELTVDASGGTAPYTYEWSDGQTTQNATGLNGGTYAVTVTDANGCTTVCDFTLIAQSGLGDLVWEDINHNGIQDPDEPGFEGVTVYLKDENGIIIDSTLTNADGFYQFIDLTPGTYAVMFVLPDGYQYTDLNVGTDDTVDNDVDLSTNQMTMNTTLDPGEFDWTLDAGIDLIPYNLIADPCSCLNNATNEDNGQFSEEILIFSYPNETWTIIDQIGMYSTASPPPPADPIPVPNGVSLNEIAPGEYSYEFIIVDSETYIAITLTNGFDTFTIENTCFYPEVNIEEVPEGELCITDDPIILTALPNMPGTLTFFVNGEEVSEVNPAELGIGSYEFIAEFVPDDTEECTATIITQFTVVENCSAFIGDFVWNDVNQDGIQDPSEPGLPNIMVIITGNTESAPYADTTFTDANGNYLFEVPPGIYKLTFELPDGFLPSPQGVGTDDDIDSDADAVMGMTELFAIEAEEVDLSWDAGFYPKCDNITSPGTISGYQFLCGPGNDPDPIVNVTAPSGGSGAMEYLWMMSTIPGPFDPAVWVPIPDSNSPTYDPGPLFETTYFARCARRECCTAYLESNIVIIEVGNVAVAEINGPSLVCVDEANTFFAGSTGPGAMIEWNFGPGATPATATGSPVDVSFSSFGNFTIELQVTEGGCTSTAYKEITVTNSPAFCTSGLSIDVEVMNSNNAVRVEWIVEDQSEVLIYTIEHSVDGLNFDPVGLIVDEMMNQDGMNYYEYIHEEPKQGRNYYRVKVTDNAGDTGYSQIVEAIIYGESKLMLIYPNPVQDQMVIELFETYEGVVEIRLISLEGKVLNRVEVPTDTKRIPMAMSNYPAGTYMIQVRYDQLDVKTFKVIKQD